MQKFLLVAVIALGLGGCDQISTGNPQVDAILARAAVLAKQGCGIEILAAQIVALIPNPTIVGAATIATALCKQIVASGRFQRRYGSAPGTVGTIRVTIGGNVVDVTVRR